MKYDLKRPCKDCPFRTDVGPYLRGGRAEEIASALAQGSDFPCHKTTEYVDDPETGVGDLTATEDSKMCAGALIMLEKQGTPNQLMRIMGRLGMYDPDRLDMGAHVAGSIVEFVRHHEQDLEDWKARQAGKLDALVDECREEENEPQCCHCSGSDCESPAGHLINGMAVPTAGPFDTTECPACGEWTCESCWEELPGGRVVCLDCAAMEGIGEMADEDD